MIFYSNHKLELMIEQKNNIYINVFCFEDYLVDLKIARIFKLTIDKDKSHYVYIKDFDRFMFHKTKNKNKKTLLQTSFPMF